MEYIIQLLPFILILLIFIFVIWKKLNRNIKFDKNYYIIGLIISFIGGIFGLDRFYNGQKGLSL